MSGRALMPSFTGRRHALGVTSPLSSSRPTGDHTTLHWPLPTAAGSTAGMVNSAALLLYGTPVVAPASVPDTSPDTLQRSLPTTSALMQRTVNVCVGAWSGTVTSRSATRPAIAMSHALVRSGTSMAACPPLVRSAATTPATSTSAEAASAVSRS